MSIPRFARQVAEPPRDALRRRLTDRELADDRAYQLEREERERDDFDPLAELAEHNVGRYLCTPEGFDPDDDDQT